MKISKKYNPKLCLAKKDVRYYLCHAFLSTENKALYAMNDNAFLKVPVEVLEGDTSSTISKDALKDIHVRNFAEVCVTTYSTIVGGNVYPHPKTDRTLQSIGLVDRFEKTLAENTGPADFFIDAAALANLQKAMGEKRVGIRFTRKEDGSFDFLSPARVIPTIPGPDGVIYIEGSK